MRVDELMSEATCCREDDSVRDCANVMKEADIGFLPICDAQGEPIGAITDRDIAVRVVAAGRSYDEPASAFMSRDVIGCRLGDDVQRAIELMRNERKSRVMVCDEQGKLKGVISLQDLAEYQSEEETGETLQEVKSDTPPALH